MLFVSHVVINKTGTFCTAQVSLGLDNPNRINVRAQLGASDVHVVWSDQHISTCRRAYIEWAIANYIW